MAFDLTGINDYLREFADNFVTDAIFSGVTADRAQIIPGIKGDAKIPNLSVSQADILQDGTTCITTDQGDISFAQRDLNVKPFKILMKFCMKDLEQKFLSQAMSAGSTYDGLDTFSGLFLQEIGRTVARQVELNWWDGEEGGANPDASFNLMDGLTVTIAADILSTAIPGTQVLAGSEAAGSVIASWEAMLNALPVDQFSDMENATESYVLFTDPKSKRIYQTDYRSTFTAAPYNMDFNKLNLDGTDVTIVGVPALFGLGKSVLMQPQKHLFVGTDVIGEEMDFEVVQGAGADRDSVYVHGAFKAAINYQLPGEIVTNNFV